LTKQFVHFSFSAAIRLLLLFHAGSDFSRIAAASLVNKFIFFKVQTAFFPLYMLFKKKRVEVLIKTENAIFSI